MSDPLGLLRLRFTGLRLLHDGPAAQVYTGREYTGAGVTVVILTDAAAADPAQRSAFAEAVGRRSFHARPGESVVHSADVHAARPWAATRQEPGQAGAEGLLAELGVAPSPSGSAAGTGPGGPGVPSLPLPDPLAAVPAAAPLPDPTLAPPLSGAPPPPVTAPAPRAPGRDSPATPPPDTPPLSTTPGWARPAPPGAVTPYGATPPGIPPHGTPPGVPAGVPARQSSPLATVVGIVMAVVVLLLCCSFGLVTALF